VIAALGASIADAQPVLDIDLPQGTVLELLNAIARSHGAMSWT
jgi:hypothetical protein